MAAMQQVLKRFSRIPGTVIALVFLFLAGVLPAKAFAMDILLGTDARGTFSHFAGRAICRVISQHGDGLSCHALPAPDRIHNLTNLQGGSLDLALVDAGRLYDAAHQKGDFEFLDIRYDNLTILVRVYDRSILLVARRDAGIDSLDQLKGKRINAGAVGSRERQALAGILDAKNWTFQDFNKVEALSSSQSQDRMAFCHGSVQAMLHIGVHPDSALQQLVRLCDAVPVNMDDADIVQLIMAHPGYSLVRIPDTAYPTVGRALTTLGTPVALAASGSLDDETVQAIMSALDQSQQALQHAHPAMESFAPTNTMPDVGIALHPGTNP
jgi:hypothetical protein